MPLNNTNIPNSSADVVGVFDADFNQVFPRARPMRAAIRESSKPMEHPIETGSVITDHRIILQNEIDLTVILPGNEYRSVYQQIKQIFLSAPLLSVQTRATTYKDMIIEKIPHEETPDMFNTMQIVVTFRQAQIVSPSTSPLALPAEAVRDPVNQSTVQLGEQQVTSVTALPAPEVIENPTPMQKGDALPQVPEPPNRSIKVTPRLPPSSPINPGNYEAIYGAANFDGVP